MLDSIRYFLIGLVSAMAAFFSPIKDFMTAAVLLFIVNFFCGLLADIVVGNKWQTKKALIFVWYCFLYFGMCAFVFACGHYMHNEEGAVQCVSYVCYLALYIYGVNIVRNLKKVVVPGSSMYKILDIIYYVLTFEFVNKIPYLSNYLEARRGDNDQHEQ